MGFGMKAVVPGGSVNGRPSPAWAVIMKANTDGYQARTLSRSNQKVKDNKWKEGRQPEELAGKVCGGPNEWITNSCWC